MSQETVAIPGVGVGLLGAWGGLAALLISGQRALRADLRGIRADLHALSDRVARLKGAFRQTDPPPAPPHRQRLISIAPTSPASRRDPGLRTRRTAPPPRRWLPAQRPRAELPPALHLLRAADIVPMDLAQGVIWFSI